MRKAIIFGITGQDGSHLADLLLEKDYQVVGVSRRTSTDNKLRINHLLDDRNFIIEECDITDPHSVYWTLDKHDDAHEIYNLAAQSFVGVSFKQPGLTWDATAKGCLNILQSIVDLKLPARFYQASSSEMFGSAYTYEVSNNRVDLDLITDYGKDTMINGFGLKYQDERTKFLPQSPYAIAKCAAHYMTRLYREAYGLHASCGILFNHEGPRRGEQFVTRKITKWIGGFLEWCAKNDVSPQDVDDSNINDCLYITNDYYPKLKLGNIHASRDWGYAVDFCEAMWMMLQQGAPDDYVICTGETHTVEEFLVEAFSCVGLQWHQYVTIDPELYRPAEVDFLKGNCEKAKKVLGWTPKHSFKDLVRIMVMSDL
jgi:GDPmannose 4,6-dehydratase